MEDGTSPSLSYCGDTDDGYDVRQWDVREDCEVRQILDRIADKWSLLVIALLDQRSLRFTELRRQVDGISQRMLARTLRHLERDGLVSRTVHPSVPPRVDYALTPLGATLHETIRALVTWTETHQQEIAAARAAYDVRAAAEQRQADEEAAARTALARAVLERGGPGPTQDVAGRVPR
ncbi:HxlR family transcriptional regulator [Micromonospora rosaria]|uniref:HxlR family transcriptional regulator n=1 Tax=Micromonospora rosaria TaxID=47874 RepID=A0A136PUJ4_9ACTN|nr:HxlR family transcriptional regulator [Micromonospora rosaria]